METGSKATLGTTRFSPYHQRPPSCHSQQPSGDRARPGRSEPSPRGSHQRSPSPTVWRVPIRPSTSGFSVPSHSTGGYTPSNSRSFQLSALGIRPLAIGLWTLDICYPASESVFICVHLWLKRPLPKIAPNQSEPVKKIQPFPTLSKHIAPNPTKSK